MNRTAWVALAVTAAIAALVVAMGNRAPFFGGSREIRTTTHQAALGEIRRLEVDLRTGYKQVGDDEYVNDAWASAAARLEVSARLGVGEFVVTGR